MLISIKFLVAHFFWKWVNDKYIKAYLCLTYVILHTLKYQPIFTKLYSVQAPMLITVEYTKKWRF